MGAEAGTNTLRLSIASLSVTFTATAEVSAANVDFSLLSGDGQSEVVGYALSDALRVRLLENGVGKSGERVTFVASSGITISEDETVTGTDGIASVIATLQEAGNFTVSASYGETTLTFQGVALAERYTLHKVFGDGQALVYNRSYPYMPTVRLENQKGDHVEGKTIEWSVVGVPRIELKGVGTRADIDDIETVRFLGSRADLVLEDLGSVAQAQAYRDNIGKFIGATIDTIALTDSDGEAETSFLPYIDAQGFDFEVDKGASGLFRGMTWREVIRVWGPAFDGEFTLRAAFGDQSVDFSIRGFFGGGDYGLRAYGGAKQTIVGNEFSGGVSEAVNFQVQATRNQQPQPNQTVNWSGDASGSSSSDGNGVARKSVSVSRTAVGSETKRVVAKLSGETDDDTQITQSVGVRVEAGRLYWVSTRTSARTVRRSEMSRSGSRYTWSIVVGTIAADPNVVVAITRSLSETLSGWQVSFGFSNSLGRLPSDHSEYNPRYPRVVLHLTSDSSTFRATSGRITVNITSVIGNRSVGSRSVSVTLVDS